MADLSLDEIDRMLKEGTSEFFGVANTPRNRELLEERIDLVLREIFPDFTIKNRWWFEQPRTGNPGIELCFPLDGRTVRLPLSKVWLR